MKKTINKNKETFMRKVDCGLRPGGGGLFTDGISRKIYRYRKLYAESGEYLWLLKLLSINHRNIARKNNRIRDEFLRQTQKADTVFLIGNDIHSLLVKEYLEKKRSSKNIRIIEESDILSKAANLRCGLVCVPEGPLVDKRESILQRQSIQSIRVPYTVVTHNDADEHVNILKCLKKYKNKCIVGTISDRHLFKELLERSGVNIYAEYDEDCQIQDKRDCLYFVFNGINKEKLLFQGIDRKRIILLVNLDWCQYFDADVVPIPDSDDMVFVDGGAMDLLSSSNFIRYAGKYKRIFAFEPDARCFSQCNKKVLEYQLYKDKVVLYKAGLWSEKKEALLTVEKNVGSSFLAVTGRQSVAADDESKIQTCSIDETVGEDRVSFIKMDIEGSELEAINGAAKCIKRDHPILAISIYHKPDDIFTLPQRIKEIDSSYKFSLRAYHEDFTEVVLYAV